MISKYSVKRPYTVLVAVVLVIVLGAVSLSKMTTDLLPDMSFQYALVVTDRKSTRLNSSHPNPSRMPSSA